MDGRMSCPAVFKKAHYPNSLSFDPTKAFIYRAGGHRDEENPQNHTGPRNRLADIGL